MPFCPAGLCMNAGSSSTTTWSKSPTGSCSQRWSTSRWAQLWSLLPAWCVHVSTAGYNVCVCVCVWQRAGDLADMITRVIREGLEGLVLKDIKVSCFLSPMETVCVWTWWCWSCVCVFQGSYEPGKRHWLKVKKDYLNEGAMADTADLVVLGAFYGKGSNGLWTQTLPAVCFIYIYIL